MRREQAHRMTGIHHERLLVGHLAQVFHREPILRPVLEYRTIATIYNKFVRMLRHGRVQVVLNHQHDGCRLLRAVRILVDRTGIHLVAWAIAIHIYPAILVQLLHKLRCELLVQMLRKIAEGVA